MARKSFFRASRQRHKGVRRRFFLPRFEKLEDRSLLASCSYDSGANMVSCSGSGDLYLYVDGGSGTFIYGDDANVQSDGTAVSIPAGGNATVSYGASDTVFLTGMTSGGVGTFNMTGPVQVVGVVDTLGGDLEIGGTSVIVGPAVLGDSGTLTAPDGQAFSIDSSDSASRTMSVSTSSGATLANGQTLIFSGTSGTTDFSLQDGTAYTVQITNPADASGEIQIQLFQQAAQPVTISTQAPDGSAGSITLTATNQTKDPGIDLWNFLQTIERGLTGNLLQSSTVTFGPGTVVEAANVTAKATAGDDVLSIATSTSIPTQWSFITQFTAQIESFFNDLADLPVSAVVKESSAAVSVGVDARITAAGDVDLESSTRSDAAGEAIWVSLINIARGGGASKGGAALGVSYARTNAAATVSSNAVISAGGDVTLTSTAESDAQMTARVSQNAGLSQNLDPSNVQVAMGATVAYLTSKTTVETGAAISAQGAVDIEATGTKTDKLTVLTASFGDGKVGLTAAVSIDKSDVETKVDGAVSAGDAPTPVSLFFNPSLVVDFANSRFQFDAAPGYTTGQALVYSSDLGGAVPGLETGRVYYAVVDAGQPLMLRLAATEQDAEAGEFVSFGPAYPTLTKPGDSVPITAIGCEQLVENSPTCAAGMSTIFFDYDPGLREGDQVTFAPAAGNYLGYNGAGGELLGALPAGSYTVHVLNSVADSQNLFTIQLKDSGGRFVDFNDNGLLTTAAGQPLQVQGFDTDSGTITLVPGALDDLTLANGDPLRYTQAFNQHVSGLIDGELYYAIVDPINPGVIRLGQTPTQAQAADPATQLANPTLAVDGSARSLTIDSVEVSDNPQTNQPWNALEFYSDPQLVDGTRVTYHAVPGKPIGGLTDGASYFAYNQTNPYFSATDPIYLVELKAADSPTAAPVALSLWQTLTDSSGNSFHIVASDADHNTVSIVAADGSVPAVLTGAALTFTDSFEVNIGGLISGQTYFAVVAPQQPYAGSLLLALAATFADATASPPTVVSLQSNVPLGTLDLSYMSGEHHSLQPATASSLTIKATLSSSNSLSTGPEIGSSPSFQQMITQGELAFRPSVWKKWIGDNWPWTPSNQQAPGGQSTATGWSLASATAYMQVDNTCLVEIGSHAVLRSGGDIEISSTLAESTQPQINGLISKATDASNTIAVGVLLAFYDSQSLAFVDSNARVDAASSLTVDAETMYPWAWQILNPDPGAPGSLFHDDGDHVLSALGNFTNEALGINTALCNTWVDMAVQGSKSTGSDTTEAVSWTWSEFKNQTVSQIADGARINQDLGLQNAEQTVSVTANTQVIQVGFTGLVYLFRTPFAIVKFVKDKSYGAEQLTDLNYGKSGSIGGSLGYVSMNNTTQALIGGGVPDAATLDLDPSGPLRLNFGNNEEDSDGSSLPGLNVAATSSTTYINIAQGGAGSQKVAVTGTLSLPQVTTTTTAQIAGDAVIASNSGTHGDVSVTADDTLDLIAIAGAVLVSANKEFGVSSSVGTITRNVSALIGDAPTNASGSYSYVATSSTSFDVGGGIDVSATADGMLIAAGLAASVASSTQPVGDNFSWLNAAELPQDSWGWGFSGDFSWIKLTDNVIAAVNDLGTISSGGEVSITSTDGTVVVAGSGSMTLQRSNQQSGLGVESSAGLAGSASVITVSGAVEAAFANAHLAQVDGLKISAQRNGNLISASASGSGSFFSAATEIAGSVALVQRDVSTNARIDDAQAVLSNDSSVQASDSTEIVSVAGSAALGGKSGFGGAAAVTEQTADTAASIVDASLSQTAGSFDVSALQSAEVIAIAAGLVVSRPNTESGQINEDATIDIAAMTTINQITGDTTADFSGVSYSSSSTAATDGLSLSAEDSSQITAVGGEVTFNLKDTTKHSAATIGASIVVNTVDSTVSGDIQGSTVSLDNGSVAIGAKTDRDLLGIAVGVGGARSNRTFGLSLVGSGTINQVTGGTAAMIDDATSGGTATAANISASGNGSLQLSAADSSTLDAIAGVASFSTLTDGAFTIESDTSVSNTTAAFGVSVAKNKLGNSDQAESVIAEIAGATVNVGGGVSLTASATPSLATGTGAGAGSFTDAESNAGTDPTASVGIAGAGAGSVQSVYLTVQSLIDGGSVTTTRNSDVALSAINSAKIETIAGGIAVAGAVSGSPGVAVTVGAAVALNDVNSETAAEIVGATVNSACEVALSAMNRAAIAGVAVGVAGSVATGSDAGVAFGGAGSGVGNQIQNTVTVQITDSNQDGSGTSSRVTSGGDVDLTAKDNASIIAAAGTLAFSIGLSLGGEGGGDEGGGGGTSVAPAIGVSVGISSIKNTVAANVLASTVSSGGNVSLIAQALPPDGSDSVKNVTIAGGVAGGGSPTLSVTFAGAGAGSGNTVNRSIVASITSGSTVTAAGNICLSAEDKSSVLTDGGGATVSVAGGKTAIAPAIGAAESKNLVSNTTQAIIDHSTAAAGGQVMVNATSQPNIQAIAFGVAISGSGGKSSFAGAGSGAAAYNDISNSTTAAIQNASTVQADAAGDNAIVVSAIDEPTYKASSGSGSLGFSFGSAASVALAVGVSLARNTVTQKKNESDADNSYPTAAASIGGLSGSDLTTVTASHGGMQITATSSPTATAKSTAVAATIAFTLNVDDPISVALSGTGASSTNDFTSAISAAIGDNVKVQADDGRVAILAEQTPNLDSEAVGVAVSLGLVSVAIDGTVASATLDGTLKGFVGGNASITAKALTIQVLQQQDSSGDPTVHASATAGSGAIEVSVDAAKSTAAVSGSVQAYTGSSVTLPDGDITIAAMSKTLQSAESLGVTVAYLAVGGNDSTAKSSVATSATLGANPSMNAARTGSLIVQANGSDQNAAWAIAGSGGVVSGDGASAKTDNSSTVAAEISGGTIYAGHVAVLASHTSDYSPGVNSINASAAGASGAEAKNTDTTSATVMLADNTAIIAAGLVTIAAQQQIAQTANTNASDINKGASAYAGAGGVITGDAAGNQATIGGTANSPLTTAGVTLGDSVSISSGTDPFANPGGISIVAVGGVDAQDLVLLSTGGLIEGGGTGSTINASLTNSVAIGSGAKLITWGNIAAGTFSTVDVQTTSQANTGGLAGTADAHATTSVTSNQSLTVGSNSTLYAFGNIHLAAGDDPTGLTSPTFIGDSNAEAYAYGGITIPHADSTATLTSNATLTINSGTTIGSGRNVTISAVDGSPAGTQSSTTLWNGIGSPSNESATANTSTRVTQNGDVVAGLFHELTVTIPNDASVGTFSRTLNISASGPSELPLDEIVENASVFNGQFKAPDFIQSHFAASDAALLSASVSSDAAPVGAFVLGPLFASGGSVTVNGNLQTSTGSISAYFGPKITVTNDSPDYLVLGPIGIPNAAFGQVNINGNSASDDSTTSGITIHLISTDPTDPTSSITIEQNYIGAVGDSQNGPALFVTNTISNLGGTVSITNQHGSLGQSATIFGEQVSIAAPNGNVAISIPPPGVEYLGTNPYSNWQNYMLWPGGNPFTSTSLNADAAVAFVANWWANGSYATAQDLTKALIGQWQSADTRDVTSGGTSFVFIGDSVAYDQPDEGGDDSCNTNSQLTSKVSNGSLSGAYQISYYPDDGETRGHFPYIPVESLSTSATAYSSAWLPSDTASPAVQARSVAITAATIDLNGKIQTTGTPTDWSVLLPSSLTETLLAYRQQFVAGSQSNPQFAIPLSDLSTVKAGDSQITAIYNAAANQITLSDVSNLSTGGIVSLTGAIISTNPQGMIDLQGGVGNVTVNNQTGIPLVVQNIDAGGAGGISQVRIIDTNMPTASNQTLYVYQPGQPIAVWTGPQDATIDQLTQTASQSGTTIDYQPESGLRWQWDQTAKLKRNSHGTINTSSWYLDDWQWESTSQNPWQYFITNSSNINGFGGSGSGWTVNNDNIFSTPIANDQLTLTDNQNWEARSAWFNTPVTVGSFNLSFVYQASGDRLADGVALVFQNQGLDALGGSGGSLGYSGITGNTAAYEINIFDGIIAGTNFVFHGATGTYRETGRIDMGSGHPIQVRLSYDAANHSLSESLHDLTQGQNYSKVYSNVDLESTLGSSTAYIGFTGATGGAAATQTIRDFSFYSSNTTYYSTPTGQLISAPGGPVFQESITGSVLSSQYVSASYDKNQASHNEFTWTFAFPTEVSLALTTSVKADNPIAIHFGGVVSQADVTINSDASVRLTNLIQGADDTSINADGSITANANAGIATKNLTLSATGGIGSRIHPLNATLSDNALNVQAGNPGVYLNLNSAATIGSITAGDDSQGFGDVALNAAGSLTAGTAGRGTANIVGKNLTLTSRDGFIGSSSTPLVIQKHSIPLANGGVRDGIFAAEANGDIAVTEIAGDLLIRKIWSNAGSVFLNVPAGSVYDAAKHVSPGSTLDEAQAVWQRLGLTDPAFGLASVTAFENLVEANYQQYWQLLSSGTVTNGQLTLSTSGVAAYTPQAAAALGVPNPSADQVQTYAASQYRQLVSFFDDNLPADWMSQADFQSFNPTYSYTATDEQIADLTLHTRWTPDQLTYAIDRAALQLSADVPLQNQTPHVSGKSVTIAAGGEVGMARPAKLISLAAIQNGTLTADEKAALALAHVAGEALYVGTDSQGNTVTFADGPAPSGVTATGVQLTIHRPLLVAVTNSPEAALNITAPGGITVGQTAGDLVIGTIDSDGVVDLAATGSIVNAQNVVSGFGGNGAGWTVNNSGISSAPITSDVLTLTDNMTNQARSAWFATPVPIGSFIASFTYQASGNKAADGVTFAFQNQGLHALGSAGGSLGYVGITGPTAAYQINLYNGHVQGTNFVTNGSIGSYFTTGSVNFTSGNPIHVALTYDAKAGTLTEMLTDLATDATFARTYTNVDLAGLLGPTAYVGFTGGTGGSTATQTIRDFRFASSFGQLSGSEVTLQSLSGSIGTAGFPLRMTQRAGQFNASAATGVFVLQTSGNLNVGNVSSTDGDIFLDPPEAGQSVILSSDSIVSAPRGHVMFQAHSDVLLPAGSVVEAQTVTIQGGLSRLAALAPDSRITLAGLLNAESVLILGGGGNDSVWIGSDGTSPGSLDRIRGQIEFRGGGGTDALNLDDRAATDAAGRPLRAGYAITPNQVGNNPGLGFPARAFAGLIYDASASRLHLLGPAGSSVFHVKPSTGTEFHLTGQPDGNAGLFGGNSIILDATETLRALRQQRLHEGQPVLGAGTWSFAEPHRPIEFDGIANFRSLMLGASAGAALIDETTTADAIFTVTYQGLTALDLAGGLGEHDAIRVIGPNGYSHLAIFVGVTPSFDGGSQIATYRVPAPGGGWSKADNGAYAIEIVPGQIRDARGRVLDAARIGTLWVNIGSLWLTSTWQSPGQYRLEVAGASPGATVVFVRGSQAGSYSLGALGLTLDLADPIVLGEAVADFSGRAQFVARIPANSAASLLGFQAIEQAPAPLASELVFAARAPRLIASIEPVGETVTSDSEVQFTVTFAQPVAGVTANDFAIATLHHIADARIIAISGHGSVYTVTIDTGTGDGTLSLNLGDETAIATATGIALNQTRHGPFAGPVVTIHKTREDVNLDFAVTALDVLTLINSLNARFGAYVPDGSNAAPWWHDVNGDHLVSPLDVLLIVNFINDHPEPAGEGEAADAGAESSDRELTAALFPWEHDWEEVLADIAADRNRPPDTVASKNANQQGYQTDILELTPLAGLPAEFSK